MNPENIIPLVQLNKFVLYLLTSSIQNAIDYYKNNTGISCTKYKYSLEFFYEVMDTLYPTNIYDNAIPQCYGFSPAKYPTTSVFFNPLYDGVCVVEKVSDFLKLPYYKLRYDNTNTKTYLCELSEWKEYELIRMIRVMYDGRNTFYQSGTPYTFERVDNYDNKRIKKRFTLFDAIEYLTQLGFPLYNVDFWNTEDYIYRWRDDIIIKWRNNSQHS